MRRWLWTTLCGLSLLAAAVTVGIWVYVAFYPRPQFVRQGEREYGLALAGYMYRLDILRCEQEEGEVFGDIMRIRAGTAVRVPMRGVEHFARDRRGHWFYFESVDGWPAVNPARALPPPVPLEGGGELRSELRVRGISMGVPYWFVTAAGVLLPAAWLFGRGEGYLRVKKQR